VAALGRALRQIERRGVHGAVVRALDRLDRRNPLRDDAAKPLGRRRDTRPLRAVADPTPLDHPGVAGALLPA
jgi:hypothetical protein